MQSTSRGTVGALGGGGECVKLDSACETLVGSRGFLRVTAEITAAEERSETCQPSA